MSRGYPPARHRQQHGGRRNPAVASVVALAVVVGGSGVDTSPAATSGETATSATADGFVVDRAATRISRAAPRVGAGFLDAVDLPDVSGVRAVWVGTEPVDARANPSATPCDSTNFSVRGVRQEQQRTFVVPRARKLPRTFGLSETLGRFADRRAAKDFVDRAVARLDNCERRVSSARVRSPHRLNRQGLTARTWRLEFALPKDRTLRYRMGLVRRHDRVAQVALSPTPKHDVTGRAFDRLVLRAGDRLGALPAV